MKPKKNIFEVDDRLLAEEAQNVRNYEEDEIEEYYIKKSSWDADFELEKISISKNSPDYEEVIKNAATKEDLIKKGIIEEDKKLMKDNCELPIVEPINIIEDHNAENSQSISLYDFEKSFDENFDNENVKKYILIEVRGKDNFSVINPSNLPTPQSKIIIDIEAIEKHSSMEFALIDYDTIFGTRFTTFIKYDSDFLACDERVFFEGLLIKYKKFGYKPFYWSKEVIYKETGIKKDRASRIISRFVELGIISTEIKRSVVSNRPQQITYFDLNSDIIFDLIPKLFKDREDIFIVEKNLKEYLSPVYRGTSEILR
ncbi:hypothetical protein JSO54_02130 [Riemerella anatipestifer]|uniref:hypothetical protein n=1 Tax=Riemerella anatipestifer TaxID=34085 RepID=UPI001374F771|nr:hypothetical protein [Riemerella anatipestifer]MDY3521063.1 hypothetical protein [Riemerella anatipestifer]MDY3533176.1 hypothetical protein [Riemerella anatipestifer]MDY3535358.1 hypothetical protein [Riemerella anatipestifer]